MYVAFYAPLKSPNSNIPSGDRRVARSLMDALEMRGHTVQIASEFQSREPKGIPEIQLNLQSKGAEVAKLLIEQYKKAPLDQKPDIWFTYHLYYKAMDWVGPIVSEALSIPYVAVEVSYAPKRSEGGWGISHRILGEVIRKADIIFEINSQDTKCVVPLIGRHGRLVSIKPFMEMPSLLNSKKERGKIISLYNLDTDKSILVTVAMMRDDAKLRSYEILGDALKKLRKQNKSWQLLVVGDGPARDQVKGCLGEEDVYFLGELNENKIRSILSAGDIFVWPSVNEAYGMAMLEAQAMGLPVIAGNTGGVGDIIRHNETGLLCEVGNAEAFSQSILFLLTEPDKRKSMSNLAIKVVRFEHSIDRVAAILDDHLMGLLS
jgi:glycosyltransferase involved in cell wall biosynthesis